MSHDTASKKDAFDLSIDPASFSGTQGCSPATAHASTGQEVLAPGSGQLLWADDGVCINLDDGKSTWVGHLTDRAAEGPTGQNELIGRVAAPGSSNGYYAHIHIAVFPAHGCGGANASIPFIDEYGTRLEGAADLPNTGEVNQYRGTALTKPIHSQIVDVVLIVDSSGSMATNDPADKRLDAAKAYLVASLAGDRAAIVDFDTTARLISGLREARLGSQANPELMAVIDTIDAEGWTNIRQGIEVACQELLDHGQAPRRGAILLTDGEHTEGEFGTPQQCFSAQAWPIFTFGFGDADWALLQTVASDTGGEYKAIADVTSLVCEFQRVRALIAGTLPSACMAQHVDPGTTTSFYVQVPLGQLQATFSTSWVGSDVVMSLIAPSERVIDRLTAAADVAHQLGPAHEVYSLLNPEAGNWAVHLFGADVPPEGEDVIFGFTTVGSTRRFLYLPLALKGFVPPTPVPTPTPPAAWTDPFNVSANSSESRATHLAVDSEQGVHVVWMDNGPGNYDIFYRQKPANGSWSTVSNLSQNEGESGSYAHGAAIVADGADTVHVIWTDDTPGTSLLYTYKTRAGTWATPQNLTTLIDGISPAIAVDAAGKLYVTWTASPSGNWDILYTEKAPGGQWTAPVNVSNTPGDSYNSEVAVDSDGLVHIAWEDYTYGFVDILFAMRDASKSWGVPVNLSNNTGASHAPAIAISEGTRVHVVWYDGTPGNPEVLYSTKAGGGNWSLPLNFSSNSGWSTFPVIAAAPDGRVFVVWHDTANGADEIFFSSKRVDGAWNAAIPISGDVAPSDGAVVAWGNNNALHVVWEGDDPRDVYYTAGPAEVDRE